MFASVIALLATQASGATGSAAGPLAPHTQARELTASPRVAPEKCPYARHAVAYYRAHTHERQSARGGQLSDSTPVVRGRSCHWARYAAGVWVARAKAALKALRAWEYDFAYWKWLPANWLSVAICESGHNPPNWEHDSGTYVSAFGIYRPGERDDSRRIGILNWDETRKRLHRFKTPREQYRTALSHFNANGDGWGCPGP